MASPAMSDLNFARSIIFIPEHSAEDGAVGYIVNHRLKALTKMFISSSDLQNSDDVLKQGCEMPIPDVFESLSDRVFFGGPVAVDSIVFACIRCIRGGVSFYVFKEPPSDLSAACEMGLRLFVGYAGWDAGQLESEIARGDWLVVDTTPELVALACDVGTWEQLVNDH